MAKIALRLTEKTKFNFYTYDPVGRDTIISIFADDEDQAWQKFEQTYGSDTIVDQVIRG